MSRTRVYELAKEAGMSSKALTDRLIELGYEIKGHSSSVDDETAEKIRNTVLKSANTELVEKRIDSGETGSTVIRRRATVIR
ncbi:MAG: translation initiation factor IF-2 N-terminal domain-containing protein, partial [Desulforhopalus sp.]